MNQLNREAPFRAASTCLSAALLLFGAGSTPTVWAQQETGAERSVDELLRHSQQLESQVTALANRNQRLQRQVARLREAVQQVADGQQPPTEDELTAIQDSATILKSDLFDLAPRVHPERLHVLQQALAHLEATRRSAQAMSFRGIDSLDRATANLGESAQDTAEALLAAVEEMSDGYEGDARHQIDRVVERIRLLRDGTQRLQSEDQGGHAEFAQALALRASVLRGELLVLMASDRNLPLPMLQSARRAALHLESQLSDIAASQPQQQRASRAMARLAALADQANTDAKALADAAHDREREPTQTIAAMADRVRNDIHNLARNSQYAPRKRLDDIYGRISRTIRQAESMSPESSERTIGLWRVVQADLAAMREASLEAATELLGAAGRPSTNLLPQPVAIDLSAEEQLGVRIANQNGRLTLAAVHPRGPAGQAGLRRGDVLVQAGGREVQTDVDLATELERTAREGEATEIVVDRNGQTIYRRIALSSAPRHVNRSRGLDGNR